MAVILVVEDHAMSRQMLKTLFGYGGHRVLEAADGTAALALARLENPDLIISDIVMPTMDGLQFIRLLRAEKGLDAIPVIFYTAAYRLPEAMLLAREMGSAASFPSLQTRPCSWRRSTRPSESPLKSRPQRSRTGKVPALQGPMSCSGQACSSRP